MYNLCCILVVPYIGTWIETRITCRLLWLLGVVPYIGTWIETRPAIRQSCSYSVVPYIGTWIETINPEARKKALESYLI